MDVGQGAAAASVQAGQPAQQTSRGGATQNQTNQTQSILAFARSASQGEGSGTGSPVSGQSSRNRGQNESGAREKEAVLAQAMEMLADLAAIDPNRVQMVREPRHQHPQGNASMPEEPGESEVADPGQLFSFFARLLQQSVGQLSWGQSRHIILPEEVLERLRKSPAQIHEAGSWWYRRTLSRGQAEAQLQELKYYVQWLCDRGPGLQILLDLAKSHGRAVGSLLLEVDVLQRIIRDAVERISHERDPALGMVDKRRHTSTQKLSVHVAAGDRANRSAQIIEHLNDQLLGANIANADLKPPANGGQGAAGELRTLLTQIRMFRPVKTGETTSAERHTENFAQITADIQEINGALPIELGKGKRWSQLEAISSLLLVRLHSAGSWVDGPTLEAIHNDVTEALELALGACGADPEIGGGQSQAVVS